MSGTASESTSRRGVLALLALAGLAIAVYLSLYQLGFISTPWDPFFGRRVDRVLDLTAPVPDALAGVLAYAGEARPAGDRTEAVGSPGARRHPRKRCRREHHPDRHPADPGRRLVHPMPVLRRTIRRALRAGHRRHPSRTRLYEQTARARAGRWRHCRANTLRGAAAHTVSSPPPLRELTLEQPASVVVLRLVHWSSLIQRTRRDLLSGVPRRCWLLLATGAQLSFADDSECQRSDCGHRWSDSGCVASRAVNRPSLGASSSPAARRGSRVYLDRAARRDPDRRRARRDRATGLSGVARQGWRRAGQGARSQADRRR